MIDYEPPGVMPFAEYVENRKRELYGPDYLRSNMTVTTTCGPITRTRWFEESTTDELRRMLQPIGADVGRRQLLALCHNRWPCGWWVEMEAPDDVHTLPHA